VTTMIAIALDEDLVSKAGLLTGLQENSALVREALKALIDRETARRMGVLPRPLPPMMRRRPVEMATDDFG
jgi:Arc/MetJ family transcription regulator